MLAITEEAATAIDEILSARQMPNQAGVRLTTDADLADDGSQSPAVRMELAAEPADGDEVLEQAPVFLEAHTAPLLDQKLLDADVSSEGVQFTIRDRS